MGIGPLGSKDLRIWGLQVQACGKAWLRGDRECGSRFRGCRALVTLNSERVEVGFRV